MNTTNNTIIGEFSSEDNIAASIIVGILVTCFYVTGLYFHIKIILVSKKEKDLTWKIDIANSILVLFLFGHTILIHAITYTVQDLYTYTGKWFCYISKVIIHYKMLYNGGYSTVISILKYLIIVHDTRFREHKDFLKTAFVWIAILHPLFGIALHLILVPDFYIVYGGIASINNCLGKSNYNKTKWWSVCEFGDPLEINENLIVLTFVKEIICKAQVIFVYLIASNVMDILFYCQTFAYMRR